MKTYDELKALIEQRGVHPVFGEHGQDAWWIEQNPFELATFLVAMQELGVQKVLELGTGWRAGLARFMANDMGWRVVSVDKNMPVSPAPNVEFLMGSTEILRPLFEGAHFDLVIIDADHRYESVKQDFEQYVALATKAIMFHDIAGLRDCEGVAKYWSEVKAQLGEAAHEIMAVGEQRGGIGWIDVEAVQHAAARYSVGKPIEAIDEFLGTDSFIHGGYVDHTPASLDAQVQEPVIMEDEKLPVAQPRKRGRKPKAMQ